MRRRRIREHDTGEAGNDSFLDILANLVGILVILVVVVSIRVQQTVRVSREMRATEGQMDVIAPAPKVLPTPAPITREDLPINGLFAAPARERRPEPIASHELEQRLTDIRREVNLLSNLEQPVDRSGEIDALAAETDAIRERVRSDEEFVLAAQQMLVSRKAEYTSIQNEIGRVVHALDEELPPEVDVVSLEHDVRAIARVANGEQIYVEVAESYLTVLPIPDLLPLLGADIRRKLRNARAEATYEGRVGPIRGVSLYYTVKRAGSSPIDDLRYGPGRSIDEQLTFTVDVSSSSESEPIDRALDVDSRFWNALIRMTPGSTVTAFVYPDSFAAARLLQEALQRRGVPLAIHPIPDGVPITHSPNGARSMAQ